MISQNKRGTNFMLLNMRKICSLFSGNFDIKMKGEKYEFKSKKIGYDFN